MNNTMSSMGTRGRGISEKISTLKAHTKGLPGTTTTTKTHVEAIKPISGLG